MSLRLQLLALGALTLLLPWAGLRVVPEMEAFLRGRLENELLTRASTVVNEIAGADAIRGRGPVAGDGAEALYAYSLSRQPRLEDGPGDWQFRLDGTKDAASRAIDLGEGSRVWLGVYTPFLYLYVDVADDEIVYQGAGGGPPYGDRVALVFGGTAAAPGSLLLASATRGGGAFRAQPAGGGVAFVPAGGYDDNVHGLWVGTPGGYSVAARIPLKFVESGLGIAVVDSDGGGTTARLAGRSWRLADDPAPGPLVREWPELKPFVRPYAGGGDRLRILDKDGWVLADSGPLELADSPDDSASPSLFERLIRYALRRDDPDYARLESRPGRIGDPAVRAALGGERVAAWYRQGENVRAIVAAAYPIEGTDSRLGAVLVEQVSDSILTLARTNEAMTRLIATSVVVSVLVAAGLLAYASLLSFRVRRLARAAETALGPRGEIDPRLPGTKAGDEIGDLSRSFADLLGRLRDYTEYLQSLKSKLSHEFRTPLAIVATSVDNLEHETATESGRAYLTRLRHGTERLESILQAMTAATRVEQAIGETEMERFDLRGVVASCVSAFRDVYAGRRFEASLTGEPVLIEGSAELIEQLLDKLVDNAVSFASAGSVIGIGLEADANEASLTVVNRGPLLPDAMRHQLFDSLVSVRPTRGEKPHLGLGLYIVTLIAEFHGGRVEAENLPDRSGVAIRVVLPRSDAGAA